MCGAVKYAFEGQPVANALCHCTEYVFEISSNMPVFRDYYAFVYLTANRCNAAAKNGPAGLSPPMW